jgi:peptidoglycan/LPS O-acetylase OafA/YrhL
MSELSGDPQTPRKEVHLEAIRGLAAFVVLFEHICLAFFWDKAGALSGSLLFVIVNGRAAVQLFFVLSGFVLSRRYFQSGDAAPMIIGIIKRWPRLAGPVTASLLLACALNTLNVYYYTEAGQLAGSPWLKSFAGSSLREPVVFSYQTAILQGTYYTFFRGHTSLNSSTWTMMPELFGSFLVYGLAAVLIVASKASKLACICIFLIAFTALSAKYAFWAFLAGVMLAFYCKRADDRTVSALIALAAGLYLLGYQENIGAYGFFSLEPRHDPYVFMAGSCLLLWSFEVSSLQRGWLSGRFSAWLGELSFPLYLVQVSAITSIASYVYLQMGAYAAAVMSIVGAVALSIPLIYFNRWWLARLNRCTASLFSFGNQTGYNSFR